ncbi:hypothetical protein HOG21_01970 [bacterium]|jgi:hypothetical protein|nr:hypothetical protein [bacterium]
MDSKNSEVEEITLNDIVIDNEMPKLANVFREAYLKNKHKITLKVNSRYKSNDYLDRLYLRFMRGDVDLYNELSSSMQGDFIFLIYLKWRQVQN